MRKATTMNLAEETIESITKYAEKTRRTKSAVVDIAIEKLMEREKNG